LPGCEYDYGVLRATKVTYEFAASYQLADDKLIYATTRRGFHSGDWNSAPAGTGLAAFGPETDTDYEIGLKSSWLDHRLSANVALFHNSFKNIQEAVDVGTAVEVSNAAGAKIDGAELELHSRPMRGLDLGLNYSYLDAHYTEYIDHGTGVNYTSEPFPSSKHIVGANAAYSVALPWGDSVTARADYLWQSLRWLDLYGHLLNISSDPILVQPAYSLVNARLTYTLSRYRAEVAVLCTNCTNKTYLEQGLNQRFNTRTSNSLGDVELVPGVPRYIGLEATMHFGGG
jgi:iron complex outermembrane receptor protein